MEVRSRRMSDNIAIESNSTLKLSRFGAVRGSQGITDSVRVSDLVMTSIPGMSRLLVYSQAGRIYTFCFRG